MIVYGILTESDSAGWGIDCVLPIQSLILNMCNNINTRTLYAKNKIKRVGDWEIIIKTLFWHPSVNDVKEVMQ